MHEDVRVVNDASKEKTDSHAGKVVERHWYDRNKHIFPANRWEVRDRWLGAAAAAAAAGSGCGHLVPLQPGYAWPFKWYDMHWYDWSYLQSYLISSRYPDRGCRARTIHQS